MTGRNDWKLMTCGRRIVDAPASTTCTFDIFTSLDGRTQERVYPPTLRTRPAGEVSGSSSIVAWSRFLVARPAVVA